MRLISHRGAAGLALENTLKSIEVADSFSPEYIEVDISRTSDGVYVMHHGNIRKSYLGSPLQMTYDELKSEIPKLLKLEDLLKKSFHSKLMFDIKSKNFTEELVAVLKSGLKAECAFTSPFIVPLVELAKSFPKTKIFISQPYQEGPVRALQLAQKYNFNGVSLNKWWLGPLPYHQCKQANLELMIYTIDRPLTMKLVSWFFPRILLCTNYPNRVSKKLLKQ
jgi:glycerophosphoryl diester phosphodiesterase